MIYPPYEDNLPRITRQEVIDEFHTYLQTKRGAAKTVELVRTYDNIIGKYRKMFGPKLKREKLK